MRLPQSTAGFMQRVRFGNYVGRRLVRAKFTELAASAETVNAKVLTHGRRVEDLEIPESTAIADRDADDDDLDDTAQLMRLQLASRGVGADRERPYTDVFPQGIDHYIAATLGDQETRYNELLRRITEHLPPTDPIRLESEPKLTAELASWVASAKAVGDARNTLAIARTARDAAVDDWVVTMERIFGALINKVGRKKADRFFPRQIRRRPPTGDDEGGENGEDG